MTETVLVALRVAVLLLIFAFGRKVVSSEVFGSLRGEGGLGAGATRFREGGGLTLTVACEHALKLREWLESGLN